MFEILLILSLSGLCEKRKIFIGSFSFQMMICHLATITTNHTYYCVDTSVSLEYKKV